MKYVLTLILISLVLAGCSRHSELHEAMEGMGDSYKAMKNAETLEQMQTELEKFSANVDIARQQKVKPEDQQTFDEGMQKLEEGVVALRQSIDSGSLADVRTAIDNLKDLKKELHDKLEVDD